MIYAFIYYLMFVCVFKSCVKQCLCTLSEETSMNAQKTDLLDSKEILRRRKSIESYLSRLADEEKDWIETYHLTFPENRNLVRKVDKHTHSVSKYEDSDIVSHKFSKSLAPDHSKQYVECHQSTCNVNKEINIIPLLYPKFSESKSKIDRDEFSRRHDCFVSYPQLADLVKDSEIEDLSCGNSKLTKCNDDIRKHTKTIKKNQYLPTSTRSSAESCHLSYDDSKTEQNLDPLSSSNNKESTISKIALTIKSDEFCVREKINFYLTKTCDAENYIKTYQFMSGTQNKKNSFIYVEKRKGKMPKIGESSEKNSVGHKISSVSETVGIGKHLVIYNNIEDSKHGISKNKNRDQNHRQNLVNSYMANLIRSRENWIETYHFSYSKDIADQTFNDLTYINSESQFSNTIRTDNHAEKTNMPLYRQERQYFIRWSKKLLNKFSDYSFTDQSSLSLTFSVDSLNTLKELSSSKKFDIVLLDDLICGLISNATLHNTYNLNSFYASYMPNNVIFLYIVCGISFILFGTLVLSRRPFTTRQNVSSSYWGRSYLLVLLALFLAVAWNALKMYQTKLAEKHNVMSNVNPAYCESILTGESGVFAHIKEYIRYSYHDEDCKKYYAALLIDPLSEISLPIIVADLISNTVFQLLRPVGRLLNLLYKDLVHGVGYFQLFFVLIVFGMVLFFFFLLFLALQRYKLNLPFFMGSVEPSSVPVGSRVEDVRLDKEKPVLQSSSISTLPPLNITNVIHLPDVYKDSCRCKEKDKLCIEDTPLQSLHPKECVLPKPSKMMIRRCSL